MAGVGISPSLSLIHYLVHVSDLSELDLPSSVKISFPNGKEKIMSFDVVLTPDEGMYR